MYIGAKPTSNDRLKRRVKTLRGQKSYYEKKKSWVAFYVACWKLGEISIGEYARLKKEALSGRN